MIIDKPQLCTWLEVWRPKYSGKYDIQYGEMVALLHKNKVDYASPIIIVDFTKAKHLEGQRFAIRKDYAQKHAIGTNGAAPMYEVPMSHLSSWLTDKEDILNTVEELWPSKGV